MIPIARPIFACRINSFPDPVINARSALFLLRALPAMNILAQGPLRIHDLRGHGQVRLMIYKRPLVITSWGRILASHVDSMATKVNTMKRKVIAWTVFGILAVGTLIFVRWFLPCALAHCAVATTIKPAQLPNKKRRGALGHARRIRSLLQDVACAGRTYLLR